jgi:hypothetical protein
MDCSGTPQFGQEVHIAMIRVMLIDLQGEKSYIECHRVPQASGGNFKCRLTGTISADYAREVAQEVAQGYVSGLTAGYRWYRQAGSARMGQLTVVGGSRQTD